jgi:hypothetical protein
MFFQWLNIFQQAGRPEVLLDAKNGKKGKKKNTEIEFLNHI